ncbi:hypothetical protein [Mesorhizobium sp.]|uniref:hypothetical protein n=1 Tax=Mesorhizobium sp. TaxID=1871066 RepID=UPI000FE7DD7B|nr:hypothetical protein [Mesorhizobium sp.]RWP46261.1 MAG: hypothetical protein EOR06_30570 [Mesorhizobium sp.]
MKNGLQLLAAVMSLIVLGGFVGIFGWVVVNHPKGTNEGIAFVLAGTDVTNEVLAYVWTGVSVLVGGVVAVAYGQPERARPMLVRFIPELIVLIYAAAYMAVGVVAVVTWMSYQKDTVMLIENAATTFLGLVLPIVSAFLKPAKLSVSSLGPR